jgi:hypothetical protein
VDKYQIFEAWAPPANPWSAWAKPAPFAHLPPELAIRPVLTPREATLFPRAVERTALIVDARGATSVEYGLALAGIGYQPVPLFNACPMPPVSGFEIARSAIDARSIVNALIVGADSLRQTRVAANAPPAFLIDALRLSPEAAIDDDTFDNRSVIFASDLPSARFLRGQGITSALLVHDATMLIGNDLLHALLPWKSAGVPVRAIGFDGAPIEFSWPRHGFWGAVAMRAFALFRLRRNAQGGYGAFVPESSGG